MNICEPGQDRNVAALSIVFVCGGFLLYMTQDEKYMYQALVQANVASLCDEVPVGCIIVKDGKIIAKAHNKREILKDPTAHAEVIAIRKAAKKLGDWQLVGCTLYVTIEPCIMCAGTIIQSRINRVVYGAPDIKGGAFGGSINVLDAQNINHRPEVTGGVLKNQCTEAIKNYFKSKR